jgi:hypothetical protein
MTASAERSLAAREPQPGVPDFFIVGQAKSGTTALYEMLRRHPRIYMPDVKEPWFFTRDAQSTATGAPKQSLAAYLTLFDAAKPGQCVGEASPSYIWSRVAAARIADVRPDARIIVIIREPASFVRSLHLQLVQSQIETEKDLRRAVALEDDRRRGRHVPAAAAASPQRILYSERVRYVEQLRRYHAVFPADQVLVLIYDDFREDNEATVRTVLRFLDVDDGSPIETLEANPTVRVRFQYLDRLAHTVSVGRDPVARALKASVKALSSRRLRRLALRLTRRSVVYGKPEAADETLMAELRRRYKPEVVALSEYLGRDLVSQWGYDELG